MNNTLEQLKNSLTAIEEKYKDDFTRMGNEEAGMEDIFKHMKTGHNPKSFGVNITYNLDPASKLPDNIKSEINELISIYQSDNQN
jgi:predicted small metal-binding protein